MEWVIIALIGFAAVLVWAFVKLTDLALAYKIVNKVEETQTDLDLQKLMQSWKTNE